MNAEDLNPYVFAKLVMDSAWKIRNRRVDALVAANEITEEQADRMPQTVADVREALTVIRHNRKVVLDTLAALEAEP